MKLSAYKHKHSTAACRSEALTSKEAKYVEAVVDCDEQRTAGPEVHQVHTVVEGDSGAPGDVGPSYMCSAVQCSVCSVCKGKSLGEFACKQGVGGQSPCTKMATGRGAEDSEVGSCTKTFKKRQSSSPSSKSPSSPLYGRYIRRV